MIYPKAVIFMGLPGSGKGTQADIVSERFGFFHFDTGKVLEREWYDPAKQNDPIVLRERKNFESGVLNSPEVVNEVVKRHIEEHIKEGR
ncbi:MAG: nucleoside monophosphate kinase, partial [Candidatus Sungbacteria bacterium]|nr:nucleoside monophosphate kinase [Candidatus Sungbacteria bacterium]